jgi:hypothetical protein
MSPCGSSGHKTASKLRRYAIVNEDDLQAAMEGVQRLLFRSGQNGDSCSEMRQNPLPARTLAAYNAARGRLAQRLEHPVYTRKVQRSNR